MNLTRPKISTLTKIERLLHPKIKEVIAKSLVYYFTIKEFYTYRHSRYQGHQHVLKPFKGLLNIGHRGFSSQYPENTLLAFEKALEHHVDMIELDVQLTQDGQIVVCHDPDLERLTKQKVFVRDLTFVELQTLEVGSWKDTAYTGQLIPRLSEVFELIPKHTLINIEIKHEATSFFTWQTEQAVLDLVKAHQREKQVIISAFNPMVVNRIRKLAPEISTAYLITQTLNPLLIFLLANIRAAYLHVDFSYLNPQVMRKLKRKGLRVLSYTLNTQQDYQTAYELGLSGIFTDHPDQLQTFLAELNRPDPLRALK